MVRARRSEILGAHQARSRCCRQARSTVAAGGGRGYVAAVDNPNPALGIADGQDLYPARILEQLDCEMSAALVTIDQRAQVVIRRARRAGLRRRVQRVEYDFSPGKFLSHF